MLPPFGPSQICAGPGRWHAGGEAEEVVPEEGLGGTVQERKCILWVCAAGNAQAQRVEAQHGHRRGALGGAQSAGLQACGKQREPAGGSS